MIHKTRLQQTV